MAKLKPCPFCGGAPKIANGNTVSIYCYGMDCPATSVEVEGYTEAEAIRRWNTRGGKESK